MRKFLLLFISFSIFISTARAQVKIGGPGAPNVNAVLELDGGTDKGLLMAKLDSTQLAALSSAIDGLVIYNTTDRFLYLRKNNSWQKLTDQSNNFALPYSGTTSALGTAFSITKTTTFGDCANFTNTAGGLALATLSGHNKLNETGGNTGIGIPPGLLDNPSLGKLVVRGTVGAVSAMFGDQTTGVALENNYPGIAFNSYYSSGRKAIAAGYGSLVGQDPLTGRFYISTSAAAATNAGDAVGISDRLVIKTNGNIGVEGNTDPQVPLSFAGLLGKKISLYRGTTGDVGMGVYGNEFRLHSDHSGANITFGYDNLTNGFTENVRFEAAGDVHVGKYATWATTADNKILKFGDGAYCSIGEIGADDAMQLRAGKFTFYNGSVAIGSSATPFATGYKLNVDGKIIAEEVRVALKSNWPDYVFSDNYNLLSLQGLENFVEKNKHLPNIPSATEVKNEGLLLGDISGKLLEKIEEMSLYIIELNKKLEKQQKEIDLLKLK